MTGPQVASHEPFTQTSPGPHDWHCAPATPQALTAVPPKHWFPEQHPEQLEGPHEAFAWHAPFAHCVPGPQAAHAVPPPPQAESFAPGRQRFPSQQPPGQLAASQGPAVWQTLATQIAVFPHAWHAPPPAPQASFAPPPTQLFPLQHPAHDCGPHPVGLAHAPATQTSDAGQDAHASPPPPHAPALVPDWHRPFPSQHPGQFCGLHPVATQTPPFPGPAGAHCDPVHAWQACPPVPQAETSVPVVHPVEVQQPAQLFGPQDEAAHTPPPSEPGAQWSPAPHAAHEPPFAPHALSSVPARQAELTQHPAHWPHGDGERQAPVLGSQVSPGGQLQAGATATQVPPAAAGFG